MILEISYGAAVSGTREVLAELREVADATRRLELFAEIQRVKRHEAGFFQVTRA